MARRMYATLHYNWKGKCELKWFHQLSKVLFQKDHQVMLGQQIVTAHQSPQELQERPQQNRWEMLNKTKVNYSCTCRKLRQ